MGSVWSHTLKVYPEESEALMRQLVEGISGPAGRSSMPHTLKVYPEESEALMRQLVEGISRQKEMVDTTDDDCDGEHCDFDDKKHKRKASILTRKDKHLKSYR